MITRIKNSSIVHLSYYWYSRPPFNISNQILLFNSIDSIYIFILLHFTTRCSFAHYHYINMKISLHTYNSFSCSCFGPSCRACHFIHIFFMISSVHDGLFSLRSSSLAPSCFSSRLAVSLISSCGCRFIFIGIGHLHHRFRHNIHRFLELGSRCKAIEHFIFVIASY